MLTERQLEIVLATVYEYIQSGEPVGSRTLSKKYLTDHSAATVRNEMADLEDLGFLAKTHTSSGRVPSNRAYRLYVDSILCRSGGENALAQQMVADLDLQVQHLSQQLRDVSRFLSRVTQCLSVAALRVTEEPKICKIDFVPLSSTTVLAVLVDASGNVSNTTMTLPLVPTEVWPELSDLFNRAFVGRTKSQGEGRLMALMEGLTAQDAQLVAFLASKVCPLMEGKTTYDTSGIEGLYKAVSQGDIEQPQGVFQLMEQPENLEELFKQVQPGRIQVSLGGETGHESLRDCAVVMAGTELQGRQAVLGLVGPLRMNYQKSIAILDAVMANLLSGKES